MVKKIVDFLNLFLIQFGCGNVLFVTIVLKRWSVIMPMDKFLQYIEKAYTHVTKNIQHCFNDNECKPKSVAVVGNALRHLCYLRSSAAVRQIISDIDYPGIVASWPDDALREKIHKANGYCLHQVQPPEFELFYSIKEARKFFKNEDDLDALTSVLLEKRASERETLDEVNEAWKKYGGDDWLIWVFPDTRKSPDRDPLSTLDLPVKSDNLGQVLQTLGLYHFSKVFPDTPFVVLEFASKKYYKPTWLDADFAFYFDPCPERDNCGYTVCLSDGRPGLPEWIAPKKDLSLVDAWILTLGEGETELELSRLTKTYWQNRQKKCK